MSVIAPLAPPRTLLTVATHEAVSDTAFPRLSTIENLIELIGSQPALRKTAAGALIDLGEAIKDNCIQGEMSALLKGTLSQEVVVRNASLQALQVRQRVHPP